MRVRRLAATAVLAAMAMAGDAHAQAPYAVDATCFAPAPAGGDPAPGTPEWQARDTHNQYCTTLRQRDQQTSPAFGFGNLTQGAALYAEQTVDRVSDPTNPRGGITTLVPGAKSADPFRTVKRWTEAGLGRVEPVKFASLNGSTLRGHVWMPPASVSKPKRGFPGVVITDGSVQGYEELYFWAAQDLASNGYVVMTYDVQGQGDSDLYGDDCPGACSGVPYQQDYNFYQGAEDSLSFFLSDGNPFSDALDSKRVGVAGHSLGASAVSHVGQCDNRVKTIVAWDNLRAIENCDGVTIPAKYRTDELINVPALAVTNDYAFNPQPMRSQPDPESKEGGFKQIAAAGLDAQIVTIRNGTHLAYTHVPLVLPSNQIGERMAAYYTLAWFDLQLKGDPTGFDRLTATKFDDSVDRTSIGAGVYDPAEADPADPYAGNNPIMIEGIPVKDAVSFYYLSEYALHHPRTGKLVACGDMRAGCASTAKARKRAKRAKRKLAATRRR